MPEFTNDKLYIETHQIQPWDHNGECLHCDGLGEHDPDCPWLKGGSEQVIQGFELTGGPGSSLL